MTSLDCGLQKLFYYCYYHFFFWCKDTGVKRRVLLIFFSFKIHAVFRN